MYNNFNTYIAELLMEMSFKDIPDQRPYGFWLSPDLQLFVVPFEGHSKIASELVFKNKKLKRDYEAASAEQENEFDFLTPMQFLESERFIRIVFDSRLRPNPKLYFAGHTDSSQIKLIKDLGMFYETPVVQDNADLRAKRMRGFYESVAFKDLPDGGFYGFWVLPGGSMEIVQNFGKHGEMAKYIILNNPILEQKFSEYIGHDNVKQISCDHFFGWFYHQYGAVRVVKENRFLRYSYGKAMTNSAKRTIKDLAMYYELEEDGEYDING